MVTPKSTTIIRTQWNQNHDYNTINLPFHLCTFSQNRKNGLFAPVTISNTLCFIHFSFCSTTQNQFQLRGHCCCLMFDASILLRGKKENTKRSAFFIISTIQQVKGGGKVLFHQKNLKFRELVVYTHYINKGTFGSLWGFLWAWEHVCQLLSSMKIVNIFILKKK